MTLANAPRSGQDGGSSRDDLPDGRSEIFLQGGTGQGKSDLIRLNKFDFTRTSLAWLDRILRGEKPGDFPFQPPTTYRRVINLKTANGLGLAVPATLIAQTEVIK
jgi:hypothetical protein